MVYGFVINFAPFGLASIHWCFGEVPIRGVNDINIAKANRFHPGRTPSRRMTLGTPPQHHPLLAVDHSTRAFPRSSTALYLIHIVTADCNRMTKAGLKASFTPTHYWPVQEEPGLHRIRRYGPMSLHERALLRADQALHILK